MGEQDEKIVSVTPLRGLIMTNTELRTNEEEERGVGRGQVNIVGLL